MTVKRSFLLNGISFVVRGGGGGGRFCCTYSTTVLKYRNFLKILSDDFALQSRSLQRIDF